MDVSRRSFLGGSVAAAIVASIPTVINAAAAPNGRWFVITDTVSKADTPLVFERLVDAAKQDFASFAELAAKRQKILESVQGKLAENALLGDQTHLDADEIIFRHKMRDKQDSDGVVAEMQSILHRAEADGVIDFPYRTHEHEVFDLEVEEGTRVFASSAFIGSATTDQIYAGSKFRILYPDGAVHETYDAEIERLLKAA